MLATAFDPLAAARDLKAAGFEQEQAEALAAQLRVAAGADHADLATKADIAALRTDTKADVAALKGDIEALRTDTKADIKALRTEMKADIEALRTATKADIASLRDALGMIRWVVGFAAAFIFAIFLRTFGLI